MAFLGGVVCAPKAFSSSRHHLHRPFFPSYLRRCYRVKAPSALSHSEGTVSYICIQCSYPTYTFYASFKAKIQAIAQH